MKRLGYNRYVVQGGDWGAVIVDHMGVQAPPGLIGIHTNMPGVFPAEIDAAAFSVRISRSSALISAISRAVRKGSFTPSRVRIAKTLSRVNRDAVSAPPAPRLQAC
jgi:hypothetical protein